MLNTSVSFFRCQKNSILAALSGKVKQFSADDQFGVLEVTSMWKRRMDTPKNDREQGAIDKTGLSCREGWSLVENAPLRCFAFNTRNFYVEKPHCRSKNSKTKSMDSSTFPRKNYELPTIYLEPRLLYHNAVDMLRYGSRELKSLPKAPYLVEKRLKTSSPASWETESLYPCSIRLGTRLQAWIWLSEDSFETLLSDQRLDVQTKEVLPCADLVLTSKEQVDSTSAPIPSPLPPRAISSNYCIRRLDRSSFDSWKHSYISVGKMCQKAWEKREASRIVKEDLQYSPFSSLFFDRREEDPSSGATEHLSHRSFLLDAENASLMRGLVKGGAVAQSFSDKIDDPDSIDIDL